MRCKLLIPPQEAENGRSAKEPRTQLIRIGVEPALGGEELHSWHSTLLNTWYSPHPVPVLSCNVTMRPVQ